jgi:hypothetical protein
MSEKNPPLLWVLDFIAPNFQVLGQKMTLTGDVLIASRQLWSLLHEDTVRSALIGPGVVKGRVSIKENPVDIEFLIGSVVFDPTEMRPGEPIPLINILNPEVVDPLEQSTPEQVQRILRTLVVKKGTVSDSERLVTLRVKGALPQTLVAEQTMVPQNISFVSGIKKARFLLGGQKRALYVPFRDALERNRFSDPARVWGFRVDKKKFEPFDSTLFRDWVIVEMQADVEAAPRDTSTAMDEEYSAILEYVVGNRDYFIL